MTSCMIGIDPEGSQSNGKNEESEYIYKDFTPKEKAMFTEHFGVIVPFLPNNDYALEEYNTEEREGLYFYTKGNTDAEFVEYLKVFPLYENLGTSVDENGNTRHLLFSGEFYVDIAFYNNGTDDILELYAYKLKEAGKDDGSGSTPGGSDTTDYTYTDFTNEQKALFVKYFGKAIPFLANDEYYLDDYSEGEEYWLAFYTFGNTEAEFEEYLDEFSAYEYNGTYVDEYEYTWHLYSDGMIDVEITYYQFDGDNIAYVSVYPYDRSSDGGDGGSAEYLYTDFTAAEKNNFITLFGTVIPFISNNEYYVEEYSETGESGLNFYTFGNTKAEFDKYLTAFSSYANDGSEADDYGDMWYFYSKGDCMIDLCYYEYNGESVVDVYIYVYTDSTGGGSEGGSGEGGSGSENVDLMTNDGKGLPEGSGGVYDADLTDATYVKDVTDQGYYLDGCPTVGKPGVLVIPVEFSDVTAASKNYKTSVIAEAFMKDGNTDYYSVYDYYYISSYNKLDLDITVLDFWFKPSRTSSYYANYTETVDGQMIEMGDQLIMDEALAYLADIMDLSIFDSDGNSIIDAVVLINTLDIGEDNFHWAYRYWNLYSDAEGNYYEYDGVSANDYLWASYQFLYESVDNYGNVSYDDKTAVNTYTFIHEFGHILGVDDYYDTAGIGDPMGGCDVMDGMAGDHNPFSKFNLGWLTGTRVVTADTSVTLTLGDFSENGDTIVIANDWDPTLGAYQEYYILMYYRNTGLNSGAGGYFERDGIVVYHVNASLYKEEIDGVVYYDIYNNNTDYSDDYGTKNNLIEYAENANDTYTFAVGDTLSAALLDNGETLSYTFKVDSLTDTSATLTFTKAA